MKHQSITKCTMIGIPIIVAVGSLLHFIYDWSGQALLVGLFAPVNESVWEHLKLGVWPTLLWWFVCYFINKEQRGVYSNWALAALVSTLSCSIFIVSSYYIHTGAFNLHAVWLDILSFVLGVAIGQFLGLHVYNHARIGKLGNGIFILLILLLLSTFALFTLAPPHVPLFMDPSNGTYGIGG